MNNKLMLRYPVALTIAGSDSGGGAGIQADLKTFSALGVYGTSVITAITAQNTQEVYGIHPIPPTSVRAQLEAVLTDITIDAVKTGMLPTQEAILEVTACIDRFQLQHLIVDPVMISTSGCRLMETDAMEVMKYELFPRATLITPNIYEAELVSGISIRSAADVEEAACRMLAAGCQAVLIKGGHLGGKEMTDTFFCGTDAPFFISSPTINTLNTHGTGCTLSSAITAYLALGKELCEAVRLSKSYLSQALSEGANVQTGHGHGPLNHFFAPVPLHKQELIQAYTENNAHTTK